MGKNRTVVQCEKCGGNMATFPHKNLKRGEFPVSYCQSCEEFFFLMPSGKQLTMVEFVEWIESWGGVIVEDGE